MTRGRTTALLACLLVAACTAGTPEVEPEAPAAKPAVAAPAEKAVAAIPPPPRKRQRPPPPPAVNDDPGRIVGLGAQALEALLGPPRLRRSDGPAQAWLYAGARCYLDVYLYRDGPAGAHRVTHYALRRAAADGAPTLAPAGRACFAGLLAQPGKE